MIRKNNDKLTNLVVFYLFLKGVSTVGGTFTPLDTSKAH
nr:hypothetical protein BN993_05188 [Virgibacillus halodenitrificans]